MIRVYLLDGSYKAVKVDPHKTSCEELWEVIADKLMLTVQSAQLFFLWGVEGNLELLLYTHHKVSDLMHDWGKFQERYDIHGHDGKKQNVAGKTMTIARRKYQGEGKPHKHVSIFRLMFRTTSILFISDEKKFSDEATMRILYIQAAHNVIRSNYPCDVDTAIKLGALQLQIVVGDQNPVVHKAGYLIDTLQEYLPEHLLAQRRLKDTEFEKRLMMGWKQLQSKKKLELYALYLEIVRKWPYYGATFFKGKFLPSESVYYKQEFQGKVRLGINENGLHMIDPKIMHVVSHRFDFIYSWNSDKNKFWYEFPMKHDMAKAQANLAAKDRSQIKRVQTTFYMISSRQAELINDLMCDWITAYNERKSGFKH